MDEMEIQPVALVTGASRGIGRAVATALAQAGYRPVLSAEETAKLCSRGGGTEPIVIPGDLGVAENPAGLVKRILARTLRLDVLVNIGSVVSVKGYENQAIYTASKHAIAGWTKSLAREVAADGIRVHLIAPGGVATDMARRMRPDIDASDLIEPEQIARAVIFLVEIRGGAVIDTLEIRRAAKTPFA